MQDELSYYFRPRPPPLLRVRLPALYLPCSGARGRRSLRHPVPAVAERHAASDFVTSDWFFSLQYKTKPSILNDDVQCPASVPSCSISPSNGTCYRGVDVPFSTEPPYLVPCGCCQREYASFPPLNSEWTTTTATSTLTVDAGYGQTLEHPSCPEPINRTCASEAKVPVCTQCGNARASFAYPPLPFVHTHVALARRSITHTPRRSQRTSTKASSPSSRTPMIPVKS